MLQQV